MKFHFNVLLSHDLKMYVAGGDNPLHNHRYVWYLCRTWQACQYGTWRHEIVASISFLHFCWSSSGLASSQLRITKQCAFDAHAMEDKFIFAYILLTSCWLCLTLHVEIGEINGWVYNCRWVETMVFACNFKLFGNIKLLRLYVKC